MPIHFIGTKYFTYRGAPGTMPSKRRIACFWATGKERVMSTTGKKGVAIPIDIGISEENRSAIVDGLSRLLADTFTLYLKTHNFHWNVTGPMFQTLHLMFEA